MNGGIRQLAALAPREEGWLWWIVLVLCVVLVFLLVAVVRRRLLSPMAHTPSDTTDSWTEAGRRFRLPEDDKGKKPGGEEDRP
jgi:hypothetical protein